MSFLSPMLDEGATLEVRWILPGALTTSMIEWFGPLSREIEAREDLYLASRQVRGLSLKIRGGARLDLKIAGGSRGALDVSGRARGKIAFWQKWSLPLSSVLEPGIESPDWIPVRKIRRIRLFSFADDVLVERAYAGNVEASCVVELTDVSLGTERWSTVGFEAMGRPNPTRGVIDAAAALVFRNRLPDSPELVAADSMSYLNWLRNRRLKTGPPY